MVNKFILLFLLFTQNAQAAYSPAANIFDSVGNTITSQASGGQHPLDVGINVSGAVVDPRARTWSLLNSTDSVNAVQSGTWTITVGNFPSTFNIGNFPATQAVTQSGTWNLGRTWVLTSGTDSVNVGNFPSTQAVTGTFFQATQPVSAASLPLPTGASTSALQTTGNTSLAAIASSVAGTLNTNITNSSIAVTGTVTATNNANGATGSTVPANATQIAGVDGSGNLKAPVMNSDGSMRVDASGHAVPVTGTFFETTQPVSGTVTANAGTGTFTVDASGHTVPVSGTFFQAIQPVSATALPLPAGASTAANQSTQITSLQSIDTKTPALGQALSGASVPVVLPAAQITTLTPPTTVAVTQATGTNLHTVVDSGTVAATQSGTWNVTNVSGTVSLPTGASTSANQSTEITSLGTIATNTTGSATSALQTTGNTSLATIATNTTGSATSALQTTGNTSLSSIATNTTNLNTTVGPLSNTPLTNSIQTAQSNFVQITPTPLNSTTGVIATDLITGNASGWYDAGQYNYVSIDIYSTSVTANTQFTFLMTNDTTNAPAGVSTYLQVNGGNAQAQANVIALSGTTIQRYQGPITARYFSIRLSTAIAAGTVGATITFKQAPWVATQTNVSQLNAANLLTNSFNQNAISTSTLVSSAAITTTTNGVSTSVVTGSSLSFNVAITAASGTTPTYDFQVQESGDGTNWMPIYQAPRQTTTGFFITPSIKINQNRYRIVETLSGTTPSFTRAVQTSLNQGPASIIRNIIDRTIAPITTNSTTASLFVDSLSSYSMTVNQGAGGSAVTFALDGSDDNINWVNGLANAVGVVGGSTPVTANYAGTAFRYIRGRVVTGVASSTISYVTLSANASNSGIKTPAPINSNASLASRQTVTTTETSIAAPTNANGLIFECESVNADNLRWGFSNSATAILSSTTGMLCEPGRDTGEIHLGTGTYLHMISTGSGSDFADLQWELAQ